MSNEEPAGEKGPDWYDRSFQQNAQWSGHYTRSEYYFIWTVIVDRIIRSQSRSVLEVGCGSGQLAAMLRDNGIESYRGIDFSPKRIEHARAMCPQFEFNQENAFFTNAFETFDYDTVLTTEFLEHVEGDIEIIQRVKSGAYFLGTVPNFPFVSHVRHFSSTEDVAERYRGFFDNFTVTPVLASQNGITFYLIDGIKT